MRRIVHLIIVVLTLQLLPCYTMAAADPIGPMLQRILPYGNDAARFHWNITPQADSTDTYRLSSDGQTISIEANSTLSVACAINYYLQRYAGIQIAWNHMQDKLPSDLPVIKTEQHTCKANLRYYLNFCTHSYTMAYWDWNRWQAEIDLMALHGINLPLITTGFESVWERLLRQYGYRNSREVGTFLTSNAYYAWFFMGNMTAGQGHMSAQWYRQRTQLARQIFQRLNEFGIQPVVPGWYGMIPENFLQYARKARHWADATIVPTGTWNAFQRPAYVADSVHIAEFSQAYYAAIDHLYSDVLHTPYFALDPFHEGNLPATFQADKFVEWLHKGLKSYRKDAVWVAQQWEGNPLPCVAETLPRGDLLLLQLNADLLPLTQNTGNHTDSSGLPHDWIWASVSNFGGNTGIFGRLNNLLTGYHAATKMASQTSLQGIGYLPEGIENNDILFETLFALPWQQESPTLNTWIRHYATMRYGHPQAHQQRAFEELVNGWELLARSIYQCPDMRQQGVTESVFLMRPDSVPRSVSTWANSSQYWHPDTITAALRCFIAAADTYKENDAFQADLVQTTRQFLGDLGRQTLSLMTCADSTQRIALQDRFLDLLLASDTLLATRTESRLGHWLSQARSLGKTNKEKNFFEQQARTLITTWADSAACNRGRLHDYANREYSGLLAAYYYPRWKAYFAGRRYTDDQWYNSFEAPFANGIKAENTAYLPAQTPYEFGSFTPEAVGLPVETALRICRRFGLR